MQVSRDELTQLQHHIMVACRPICPVETDFAHIDGELLKIPTYAMKIHPTTTRGAARVLVHVWNITGPSSKGTPMLIGPAHSTMPGAALEVAKYIALRRIVDALESLASSSEGA